MKIFLWRGIYILDDKNNIIFYSKILSDLRILELEKPSKNAGLPINFPDWLGKK